MKIDYLFKDPLRGIKWVNKDEFPYERGKDEIELDFITKSSGYVALLCLASFAFFEGGFIIYSVWFFINFMRFQLEEN